MCDFTNHPDHSKNFISSPVPPTPPTPSKPPNAFTDYTDLIGVPFVNHGRVQATGLDCYGLTKEVFRRCGREIGEYYVDAFDMAEVNGILRNAVNNPHLWQEVDYLHGEPIPVPALVALRFNSPPGIVNHTGVYIGMGRFIHTRERIGVCVDRLDSIAWKRHIVGIYRYVGDKQIC